jgi:hypothetical protein
MADFFAMVLAAAAVALVEALIVRMVHSLWPKAPAAA